MSIPLKDSLLVPYGANFDAKVTASPQTYSLTAPQALAFHNAYATFLAEYNAVAEAREAGTRSKMLTAAKTTAKKNLLRIGRELYGLVQNSLVVSNADKIDIGVHVRDSQPSPRPVPGTPGDFTVELRGDGALQLRWKCANPPGTAGTIYQIARRIGATGEFVLLGGTGTKSYLDTTVPAGSTGVTYQIQAVRSTGVGLPAQFNVNFGVSASGQAEAGVRLAA